MKATLVSVLFFSMLVLTSCGTSEVDKAKASADDVYRFQSIEYYLDETMGDGTVNIDKMQPVQVYYNKTSSEISVTAGLYEDLTEYSLFTSVSKPAIKFDLNNVYVDTPSDIKDGKIIMGGNVWKFSFSDLEKRAFDDYRMEKDYQVSPYTALTIGTLVNIEKISASYIATFVGEKTGDIIKVKGKWEGTKIIGSDIKENFTKVE